MRIDAPIITGSFSLNGSTLGSLTSVATTGSNTFLGGQSATSFAGDQLTANDRAYLRRIDGIAGTTIEVIAPISASAGITGSTNFNTIVNKPTLVSGSSQVIDILSSLNSATASFTPRITNLESKSASVDISITNINSYTASQDTKNTTLGSYTGSNDTKWTSIGNLTGSYATTGSNTFFGTQTYSGSVYIANDLIVQGSSSIQYISASSVSIGTNIVQLNTANPSVRFAGLTIIDSGSIGGSGSFLYDSVQDEFIFVHRGNNTNVTSSHFVLGPETYDSLGNETYLTTNILSKGTGKEHLIDSCIFDNGTTTCIKNNLVGTGTATIGSDIILSAANPVIYGGTAEGGVSISNNTGGSYIKIFGASHVTTPNTTAFINANSTVLTINALGNMGIGTATPCSILHLYGVNPSLIIQNSNTSTVGNTANIIFRNLLSTGAIHFAGYIAGIQKSTSANTGDLSFNTYNAGSVIEGIRISSTGCIGINCTTPGYGIDVNGTAHFTSAGGTMLIESTQPTNQSTLKIIQCSTGGNGNTDQGLVVQTNAGDGTSNIAHFYDYNSGSALSRLVIRRNGNVGIGCSAPGAKLSISGAGSGFAISYGSTVPNNPLHTDFYGGWSGIGMGSSTAGIRLAGDSGGNNLLDVGYYKGNSVSHACWCSKHTINESGYSTFAGGVNAAGTLTGAGLVVNGGSNFNGGIYSQTQRLTNTTGGYANMIHKVQGCSGSFSQLVICVSLNGAGGWGYIINGGGTNGGTFQAGGGYTNGTINQSNNITVGSGFTVSSPANDVIRFVGGGGVHPFVSIQMFGSLSQQFGEEHVCIYWS